MVVTPTYLRGAQSARLIASLLLHQARDDPRYALRSALQRYGHAICVRPDPSGRRRIGKAGKTRKKGKIGAIWVIAAPELIEALLIRARRSFDKDPLTSELEDVLGQGLLVAEGQAWKHDHKLVQPVLNAGAMRRRVAEVTEVVEAALDRWPPRGDLDCTKLFGPVTLEVVSRVTLGVSLLGEAVVVAEALDEILDYYAGFGGPGLRAPKRWRTPARRRMERACERLREVTRSLIQRRAAKPCAADADDALGRLIAAHRLRPEELPWSRVEDQAITLMLAGNETTTLGLAYALHALAANPQVHERWRSEADDARRGGIELDRLPWTRAIWRETLRMAPPAAGVGRLAREDVELCGIPIAQRSLVVVPAMAMHRLPEWFPDPDTFMPQRFIDPPTWPKLAYLPFGAGPRVCIGSHLADIEAIVALTLIGQRYILEPQPGARPLRFKHSVTVRPAHGVPIRLRQR